MTKAKNFGRIRASNQLNKQTKGERIMQRTPNKGIFESLDFVVRDLVGRHVYRPSLQHGKVIWGKITEIGADESGFYVYVTNGGGYLRVYYFGVEKEEEFYFPPYLRIYRTFEEARSELLRQMENRKESIESMEQSDSKEIP